MLLKHAQRLSPWSHLFHGLLDVLGVVGGDVRVQGLVLPGQGLAVLAPYLTLLHRPLASDDDLSPRLGNTRTQYLLSFYYNYFFILFFLLRLSLSLLHVSSSS